MPAVRVGQIWRSTDRRDVATGRRQRRRVTSIIGNRAYLHTEGGKHSGSIGVRMTAEGIERHALVSNPSGADEAVQDVLDALYTEGVQAALWTNTELTTTEIAEAIEDIRKALNA